MKSPDPDNQTTERDSISLLSEEIHTLAEETGTLILAHNYQIPEIQTIADKIGDSLELARAAQETDARAIIFCGVDFMADTAKILNPDTRVLNPDPKARCAMAHMVDEEEVKALKDRYPGAQVVSYVNTTTSTKAISDICCTSANAIDIVESCSSDQVIFVPDRNLAAYVQRFSSKEIIPALGYCYVHHAITAASVTAMQNLHPGAPFIAHPECRPEIIDMADAICSTGGMAGYCRESPESSFIIGTESGMLHRLRQELPDRKFFAVAGICTPMKRITLEKVRDCILNGTGEIVMDKDLMDKARAPLERMIDKTHRQKSRSCRTREEIRKGQ